MDGQHSAPSQDGSPMTDNDRWIAIRAASSLGSNFLTMDEEMQRVIVSDWVTDLRDFPRHILEAAFMDHRRSSTFPPKPAEIIRLASSKRSDEQNESVGEMRFKDRRLSDTRSWLGHHLTVGQHMIGWGPMIVPDLLREGYTPERLWDAGFRTDQLRELAGANRSARGAA